MVCTSRGMAGRVAAAGADKMELQGYAIAASTVANAFYVSKPSGETVYEVEESESGFTCDCAFFTENAQYGCCKHIIFTIRHKDESERCDILAAQYARPIDCEEIDAFRPVVKVATPPTFYAEIAEYHREANRSDLSAKERAALHCEYDRLYKYAI